MKDPPLQNLIEEIVKHKLYSFFVSLIEAVVRQIRVVADSELVMIVFPVPPECTRRRQRRERVRKLRKSSRAMSRRAKSPSKKVTESLRAEKPK